jgi:hypothetical protein
MAGSCEHCNEPSTFINDATFLEYNSVTRLLASQEGLYSMKLVSVILKI